MWMANSLELGPGMRLLAPSRSRNFSRESHLRRRTSSSSIMAMCPAGPPLPSRRKKQRVHRARPCLSNGRNPRFPARPFQPLLWSRLRSGSTLFSNSLNIIEQRHEAEVHVKLLVTMEPRQPRLRRWFLPVFKHVNGVGLETDRLCERSMDLARFSNV